MTVLSPSRRTRSGTSRAPTAFCRPRNPHERRHPGGSRLAIALVATIVTSPACSDSRERPVGTASGPPSVLLITLDTTRADSLSCYGAPAGSTPALDSLAAGGTLFRNAHTVAPLTLPAHCSLFTGLLPFEHGVRDNGSFQLDESATTLAELFAAAGYDTAAVLASPVLDGAYGLAQGFDQYFDSSRSPTSDQRVGRRHAAKVREDAESWLKGRDAPHRPFFLWAHFFDPHRPWEVRPEFVQAHGAEEPGLEIRERERRMYAASIAWMDQELGQLQATAERLVQDRDQSSGSVAPLLTVVVSDHGEGMGDHGEGAHGFFLYDSTIRMVMLAHGPGVVAGQERTEAVSMADIAPTLLSWAGIPGPPSTGVDLSSAWRGESPLPDDRSIYFETLHPYNNRWSPLYGVLHQGKKLIDGPAAELFDLTDDPAEQHNRIQEDEFLAQKLRARIRELASRYRPSSRRQMDEEERQQLEALGYLTSSTSPDEDPDVFRPGQVDPQLRNPRDGQPLIRLHGQAYTKMLAQDYAAAAELMLQVVEQDPENPYYLDEAGSFFLKAGKPNQALPLLKRSAAIDPRSPTVWFHLGRSHQWLEQYDAAIESFQKLLESHPTHVDGRLKLAQLLSEQRGQHQEAATLLEETLRHLPAQAPLTENIRQKITELRGKPSSPR